MKTSTKPSCSISWPPRSSGERPTSLPAQEPPTLTANVLLDRYQATLDGGLRDPFLDPLDLLVRSLTTTQSGVASRSSNLRLAPPSPITDQIFDSGIDLPTTTPAPGGTETLNTLLLFCLPENDVLARYWETVADRMFKIRHCMNLSGQVRQLALFAPPIDPALLVRAAAAGLEIQAVVASLFESLPHYRFSAMLQKAHRAVRRRPGPRRRAAVGDAEPGRRGAVAPQEHPRTGGARVDPVAEAEGGRGGRRCAGGAREEQGVGRLRRDFYSTQERVSSGEQKSLDSLESSRDWQKTAEAAERRANVSSIIPNVSISATSISVSFGGSNLGAADQANASGFRAMANADSYDSTRAATIAGYDRRLKDWRFQADLAKKEVEQLDKQILAAEIRKQIAATDLANHEQQIASAAEVDELLTLKFTNQQLYSFMTSRVSRALPDLSAGVPDGNAGAVGLPSRARSGRADDTFVSETNWDSLRKGLAAGELLLLDLRRMETAHLDANQRRARDHQARLAVPARSGTAAAAPPDRLLRLPPSRGAFDLDFAGHYYRRIKAVQVTIPGIIGPYTNVSATLSLVGSWTRRHPTA